MTRRSPDLSRHPWLDGRFASVETMSDTLRIWTFLAAHTAAGNLSAVERDWAYLPPSGRMGAVEIILQTHLFAGFPRTINALKAIVDGGAELPVAAQESRRDAQDSNAPTLPERWSAAGQRLCRAIYQNRYEPLRGFMRSLHPDLDLWMLETGYGRVLSRAGATPRERELCVIAVLSGQNVEPQLRAHLLGSLNVGATVKECQAVLSQTEAVWGSQSQVQVDLLWGSLMATRRL